MRTEHHLHVITSKREKIDIPLTDSKEEAQLEESFLETNGTGKVLALRYKGKTLYAPTNATEDMPDHAYLHFIDGTGQVRHVHGVVTRVLTLETTYTSNFSTEIDFPYGGRIVIKANNGGTQGFESGTRADGGSSGHGWKIQLQKDDTYVELIAPSGGGGGGNGETKSGSIYSYTASGGTGSTLTIDFKRGKFGISGQTGYNGGSRFTYHANPYGNDGGSGGDSWPYPNSSATDHKGGAGRDGSDIGYYGTYGYYTTAWGGSGGRGGYGSFNYVCKKWTENGVDKTPEVAELSDVDLVVGGMEMPVHLKNTSQSSYAVEIYKYEFI